MAKKKGKGRTPTTAGRGDQTQRLKDISAIPSGMQEALGKLDIVRADQLTAAARIPQVRGALIQHLRVSDQDLDNAVTAASATLPTPAPGGAPPRVRPFPLGALKPPPEQRAEEMSIPLTSTRVARASLPASVNLVAKMPPIRDQGNRGTCVAFCLTAIHEYETRANNLDFSERYLYYEAKAIDHQPADCGTYQKDAAQVLEKLGQCLEAVWPYNPNGTCNDHGPLPPKANADATKRKLAFTAVNPHDIIAIKTAVAAGRPVGVSIPVFVSWYQSPTTERTGRITMPIGNEHDVGGHCMCVVGYQDDGSSTVTPTPGGGFFILRNSWSTEWGKECAFGAGYGTIPYGYIAAYNWESYTVPAAAPKKEKKKTHARKKTANTRKSAARRGGAKHAA